MPRPKTVRFRLYPRKKPGLYFVAHVWPDLAAMVEYLELTYYKDCGAADVKACCVPIRLWSHYEGGRKQKQPFCGELHFSKGWFTATTTSHEVTHATFAWAQRIGLKVKEAVGRDVSESEEQIAEALGFMMGQLNYHAYRLKLWSS
jgi:hypothetical protein